VNGWRIAVFTADEGRVESDTMNRVSPDIRKAWATRFMHRTVAVLALTGIAAAPAVAADLKAEILAAHNAARAEVGTPPLAWSAKLAADAAPWAQELARRGRLEHSAAGDRSGEGENLWMGTAGGYTPAQMVGGWASEHARFHPGVFPDVSKDGWQAVGHYTQMIWRDTNEVGCALAHSERWDVLVCRYAPAGNRVGEAAF
jgi:hypothetical protein